MKSEKNSEIAELLAAATPNEYVGVLGDYPEVVFADPYREGEEYGYGSGPVAEAYATMYQLGMRPEAKHIFLASRALQKERKTPMNMTWNEKPSTFKQAKGMKTTNPEAHQCWADWQDCKEEWRPRILNDANNGFPRWTMGKFPIGILVAWAKDICARFVINLWQVQTQREREREREREERVR